MNKVMYTEWFDFYWNTLRSIERIHFTSIILEIANICAGFVCMSHAAGLNAIQAKTHAKHTVASTNVPPIDASVCHSNHAAALVRRKRRIKTKRNRHLPARTNAFMIYVLVHQVSINAGWCIIEASSCCGTPTIWIHLNVYVWVYRIHIHTQRQGHRQAISTVEPAHFNLNVLWMNSTTSVCERFSWKQHVLCVNRFFPVRIEFYWE